MTSTSTVQNKKPFDPFAGSSVEVVIPITQSQAEIWTACKFGGDDANRAYNDSVTVTLKGHLNKAALMEAFNALIQRHEALRAVFSSDGRFMTVFEDVPIVITYEDLSELDNQAQNQAITEYLVEDANFVFDLGKGPLLKVGLLKKSELERDLIIMAHHIICDGWSIGVLLEELGSLYSSNLQGGGSVLPVPENFSSYADEQQFFEKSEQNEVTEAFWRKQYETKVPQVTIPTDFPRPTLRTFKSERQDFILDNEVLQAIKRIGVQNGCSLVNTLVAVFEIFLFQKTGQKELVVGLPSAGQATSGKMQLIGHCVNLLPLRSTIIPEASFQSYLKQRKSELFDAYEHSNLSFGQLLQKLPITRDPSRVPLVPIVFNIDIGLSSEVYFEGLTFEVYNNPRAFEAFELFLNAGGTEDEVILEWSYNSNLFKPSTITEMMGSFEEIIHRIIKNPESSIGDIVFKDLPIYSELNNTYSTYPQKTLYELLLEQAKSRADKVAIQFGETQITYEELDVQASNLAHRLQKKGVRPSDYVGVALPRSEKLVISLMAIMKCGAAYLPLDPSYPVKRLKYMLEDSGSKLLITSDSLAKEFIGNYQVLLLEDLFSNINKEVNHSINEVSDNNSIAYLLYTSGSTGRPKGVSITHKNLVNFLCSMAKKPGIEKTDKLLSITTISFDIAGLELFLPLLSGATLVLTTDEITKDGRLLLNFLKNEGITMLQATPSTWQMLLDVGWQQKLPIKALSGGEALPLRLAHNILKRTNELWNMYGPTETTIWSSIKKLDITDEEITIGKPIANTQLYILNENGLPVNSGAIGEIAIGGDGVAKGYWNREDLTNEKFIHNPFIKAMVYMTGDLGKILPNSEIQCLGRKDQQVKIRGHRIELGEIEQSLEGIDAIQRAVVLVDQGILKAYLVLTSTEVADQSEIQSWKKQLQGQLPKHMVPNQYQFLEKFPTTLNGKIDRKALLSHTVAQKNERYDSIGTSETENSIAEIWKQSLGISEINHDDNFFELGGHSLIAVKVMALLEKKTGKRLPLGTLLEYPTIRQLASVIEKEKPSFTWNSLVPIKPNGNKTPLFIAHGANYNVLVFEKLAQTLHPDQPVYGLQAKGIDGTSEPDDTVEQMAANFIAEIQTVYPEGPYSLAGFSFGGIIVYEMYRQLTAQNIPVKTLSLFDSYVYPNYYFKNALFKKMVYQAYFMGHLFFMLINMFSNKKNFNRRIDLLKIKFKGIYIRLRYGKERQMKEQFNRNSKIDEKHALAFYRYSIQPTDVCVDLFRATENVYFAHDFKYLGWKNIAKSGIRLHKIPGNHNDMLIPPNVEVFAEKLQYALDNNESN